MHGYQSSYTIELLIVYALTHFSGFLNEWLVFHDLFCEGSAGLRIYASTAVKRLRNTLVEERTFKHPKELF